MANILIVEDRTDNREFIADLLRHFDHRVTAVTSASAAMFHLRTQIPDLIVTDLLMPDIDGYEFARQLRTNPDLASIPIVFWTAAYSRSSARALAKLCGVDHVLAKPSEPEAILETVNEILRMPNRAAPAVVAPEFEREHAMLLTNKIFDQLRQLESLNQRLRESERQYRMLFESNPLPMWILDGQSNGFLAVNDAAVQQYGYTEPEFLELKVQAVVVGEAARHEEDAASETSVLSGAVRHRLKSGEVREVECFDQAIQFDGRSAHLQLIEDVTSRNRTDRTIRESRQQLRELSERLRSAQEDERTRISRSLHDEMGPRLTALRMTCEWIVKKIPPVLPRASDADIRHKLNSSIVIIDEMIAFVQKTATALRPGKLDYGIGATIEWFTLDFQSRSEIVCDVDVPEDEVALGEERATEVYRIFQEALTNVGRHSGASRLSVKLKHESGHMVLTVHDDGRGITQEEADGRTCVGILGMRERAAQIGSLIEIEGASGVGTTVRLTVPLADRAAAGR